MTLAGWIGVGFASGLLALLFMVLVKAHKMSNEPLVVPAPAVDRTAPLKLVCRISDGSVAWLDVDTDVFPHLVFIVWPNGGFVLFQQSEENYLYEECPAAGLCGFPGMRRVCVVDVDKVTFRSLAGKEFRLVDFGAVKEASAQ